MESITIFSNNVPSVKLFVRTFYCKLGSLYCFYNVPQVKSNNKILHDITKLECKVRMVLVLLLLSKQESVLRLKIKKKQSQQSQRVSRVLESLRRLNVISKSLKSIKSLKEIQEFSKSLKSFQRVSKSVQRVSKSVQRVSRVLKGLNLEESLRCF